MKNKNNNTQLVTKMKTRDFAKTIREKVAKEIKDDISKL